MLNMETIPARIVGQADTKSDVITLQLIENLGRENLNPIDEANAYVEFLRTKIGAIDVDGIISLIITYERDPARVETDFAANFAAVTRLTGKSSRSTTYLLSLLKLPPDIRDAVKDGTIGLSQGYLFAANLKNPQLMEIFKAVMKKPVTYEALKRLLEAAPKTEDTPTLPKPAFAGLYAQIRTVKTAVAEGKAAVEKEDIEQLIAELEALCTLLKEQARK
jgi:ParB-like chromosome segregation protein Spo0J